MTVAHGKLGKQPAAIPDGLAPIDTYLKTTSPFPTLPPNIPAPTLQWGMDGNDQYGCCVVAAAAHAIAAWNAAMGTTDPVPDAQAVIDQYKQLTGCQTPGDVNDTGLVISEFLEQWRTAGMFGGHKILAYGPVSRAANGDTRQTIANFVVAINGYQLPQSAEAQFDAGQPWSYVPGSPSVGGHCTIHVGYSGLWIDDVTWGAIAPVGPQFLAHNSDELWVAVPEAFAEKGKGPDLDLDALLANITALKGT